MTGWLLPLYEAALIYDEPDGRFARVAAERAHQREAPDHDVLARVHHGDVVGGAVGAVELAAVARESDAPGAHPHLHRGEEHGSA